MPITMWLLSNSTKRRTSICLRIVSAIALCLLASGCRPIEVSGDLQSRSLVIRETISIMNVVSLVLSGGTGAFMLYVAVHFMRTFVEKKNEPVWSDFITAMFLAGVPVVLIVPILRDAVTTAEVVFQNDERVIVCTRGGLARKTRTWSLPFDQVTRVAFTGQLGSGANLEISGQKGTFCVLESFTVTAAQRELINGVCARELGDRCR